MINLKTKHEIELMARAGSLLNSVITEMKAACEPMRWVSSKPSTPQ